jgi:hypothetical protein
MSIPNIARRLPTFILLLLAVLWLLTQPTLAQDDGPERLHQAAVGAYTISVWTGPEPPVHGPIHIVAQLTRAESGESVTTPEVTLIARAPHHDVLQVVMTPQNGRYAADITIPYAETWIFELVVKDDLNKAQVAFPLDIQTRPIDENMIRLGAFATLVVLVSGWWFWGRHPRKKKVRKRIFMPRPDEFKRK